MNYFQRFTTFFRQLHPMAWNNHNFSMFRFTNSLKSLTFSKFLESNARS